MTGDTHPEDETPDDAWQTYRMDPGERPTDAVVLAVAAVKNVPALELEPLHDTIETDALDQLIPGSRGGDRIRVRFTYADCVVEVTNSIVRVREHE